MQLIGFLGGMSWESTAEYYRLANETGAGPPRRTALGALRARTRSTSPRIERMQAEGRWEDAAAALGRGRPARSRRRARTSSSCARTRCTRSRTPSTEAVDIPLLHIGDTTAAAVTSAGVRRVGLLGTGFTMAQPFYADRLRRATAST